MVINDLFLYTESSRSNAVLLCLRDSRIERLLCDLSPVHAPVARAAAAGVSPPAGALQHAGRQLCAHAGQTRCILDAIN